jgi:endonuclease/exonuclease/phosphatase family metal-dependent hydrolase
MTTVKKPSGPVCTVMTYNLHGCVGTDNRYDPERSLAVIQEVRPAVLGLQEVRRNRTKDFIQLVQRNMPDHHVLFLKTLTDTGGEYGNALVSRYPVLDHIDISLDSPGAVSAALQPDDGRQTGRTAETRRAIFARLDVEGTPLWVIVTHLGVERWARRKHAQKLVSSIHGNMDLESEPAVLMGDINEWRWPNPFLRLLDRTFSRHNVRRTFPSRFPLLPLDRVWMTRHLQRKDTWAHRSRLSRRASDHLPLCVTGLVHSFQSF